MTRYRYCAVPRRPRSAWADAHDDGNFGLAETVYETEEPVAESTGLLDENGDPIFRYYDPRQPIGFDLRSRDER